MPKFNIRVGYTAVVERWGYVEIEAETPEAACAKAVENGVDFFSTALPVYCTEEQISWVATLSEDGE
jgi:hypothetical protein